MTFRVLSVDDSTFDDERWQEALRLMNLEGSAVIACELPEEAAVGDIVLFRCGSSADLSAWGKVLKRRRLKPSQLGNRYYDVDLVEPSTSSWSPSTPVPGLPVVRIVDFGGSALFEQAATATAENLRALLPAGVADQVALEIVRTTSVGVVGEAIADGSPRLVHVNSHGAAHREGSYLTAESGEVFSFAKLAAHLSERRRGRGQSLGAQVLLLDACDSARGDFQAQLAELLDRPLLFVGATREVYFDEATCFFNGFYAALAVMGAFSAQMRDVCDVGQEAFGRALVGYRAVRGEPAPFTARVLDPAPGGLFT